VSFVKSHDKWLFFDDESVEAISEATVQSAFGLPQEYNNNGMDHGYILMYNRQEPVHPGAPPGAPPKPPQTSKLPGTAKRLSSGT